MTLQTDLLTALAEFHNNLGNILTANTADTEAPAFPAAPLKRGDVVADGSPVVLARIPAGTVLRDMDGDHWYKHDNGVLNMNENNDFSTGFNPADYPPLVVVSVRNAVEPDVIPGITRPFQEGDRVSVPSTSAYDSAVNGTVGTVKSSADYDDEVFVEVDNDAEGPYYFKADTLAAYTEPATAPPAEPLADWERELLAAREPQVGNRVIAKVLYPGYVPERQGVTGHIHRVDEAYPGNPKGYVIHLDHPESKERGLGTKATEVELIGDDVPSVGIRYTEEGEVQVTEAPTPAVYVVGDVVPVGDLAALPVGTIFTDKDRDRWHVQEDGFHFQGHRATNTVDSSPTPNPERWAPLTVVSTPVEEAAAPVEEEAEEPATEVDVDEANEAHFKADYNQAEIRVEHSIHGDGGVYISMETADGNDEVYTWLTPAEGARILKALQSLLPAAVVTEASTEITLKHGDKAVFARRSGATDGVRLAIQNEVGRDTAYLHLDPAETAALAATLTKIAQ